MSQISSKKSSIGKRNSEISNDNKADDKNRNSVSRKSSYLEIHENKKPKSNYTKSAKNSEESKQNSYLTYDRKSHLGPSIKDRISETEVVSKKGVHNQNRDKKS